MKIGNVSNNVAFGKIYQVMGSKKDMEELKKFVSSEKKTSGNPAMTYNLTRYSGVPKAISDKLEGKQLFVIVTGEDSNKKTNGLTGKDLHSYLVESTDKLIKLTSNVKRDAVEILQSIKNNK